MVKITFHFNSKVMQIDAPGSWSLIQLKLFLFELCADTNDWFSNIDLNRIILVENEQKLYSPDKIGPEDRVFQIAITGKRYFKSVDIPSYMVKQDLGPHIVVPLFGICTDVEIIQVVDTNILLHNESIIKGDRKVNICPRTVKFELGSKWENLSESFNLTLVEPQMMKVHRCHEIFERVYPIMYEGQYHKKMARNYPPIRDYQDIQQFYNSDLNDFTILVESIAIFREIASFRPNMNVDYRFVTADRAFANICNQVQKSANVQEIFQPTFYVEDLTRWNVILVE